MLHPGPGASRKRVPPSPHFFGTQIEADLTSGAGAVVDLSVPEPKTPAWIDQQKAPLLIGQLKAIAAPFYTRLHAADPAWLEAERITNGTNHADSIFPWTPETSDDTNKAVATIGQLKAVFSLRFATLDASQSLDSDGDGLTDAQEAALGTNPNNPAENATDHDGDGIANELDADPSEKLIDWERAPETSYVVIDLMMRRLDPDLPPHGRLPVPAVLNDHNGIARYPYIDYGEKTPATWDGKTFPITWHRLPDFLDANQSVHVFSDFWLSFNNSDQTFHGLPLDDGSDDSPGVRAVTVLWNGLYSAPSRFGNYSVQHSHILVDSRFDQLATWKYTTANGTEITAPGFRLVDADQLPLINRFNFYSCAPNITRTGKILFNYKNRFKINEIDAPSPDIYGMTADPHDATLVALGGYDASGSMGTMRYRNGTWELMPMPGIMDMNAAGVGITFPEHQIWRNGKVVHLDELLEDSGWTDFKAEQINKHGSILGSARQNGRSGFYPVLLLPVEVVSRDKYLAGSFSIPSGWDSLEMEFVGPDGSLGKYCNLLGGGSTKIYDKVEDIMADPDYAAGGQVVTQKVWFVRDSTDARKINYYTCFDSTGDVQIKLYLNGKPEPLGEITHTLTAAEDFAAVIDYVDEWVKGTSFDFTGGIITSPLAMRAMSMNAAGGGGIHNLTRAALIPFFNVVNNVEGLGSVAFGLFDGIKEGVSDDYKLIQLIKSGALGAGGWAIQAAEAELNKWKDDPLKRAAELKKAADRLCQEWVFKPMEQVQADLSTWEGFKKRSWQVWKSVEGTANKAWVVTQSSWESIKTGLKDWVNDFADRMMEGAEKAHWSESVLSMDKIQGDINEYTRQASYTFGYTFGYISEQVAVGILTGGTVKVAAIMTKGGVKVAGALAARRVLPVVARLQFVKKWAASVAISIEMKIAVERGLTIAADPLSALIKDSVAEVIERGMARATYERASFSTSKVLDEVLNGVFLKKLIATPGLEGRFWQRMGEWFHLLADDATAAASKGWVKVFNRSLKFDGDILLDDRMPDLYKLVKAETVEGKKALKKSLDEFGPTDGSGKFWLRDLDTIYEDMYHHLSASSFNRLRVRNGNAYLSEFTGDRGWYVTPDKFTNAEDAKSFLQLDDLADGRYRCKFKTAQAKDNLKAARGDYSSAAYYEFICKDYPLKGAGGASQLLLDHKEVLLDEVFDTVLQRNLTIQELQNLGSL